jgi:glycosyltransferase involved in cell wall biosynthesis
VRVLHIAPSIAQSYGGPTQSLAGYAAASRTAAIEVAIAAPISSKADITAFASRAGEVDLHQFRSFGSAAFATSPSLVRWMRRVSSKYDVVHVHGLFNPISSFSARAAIRAGVPLVIRPFGTLSRYTFEHRRTALKKLFFNLVEKNNIRRADGLHFTTATERDDAKWHGIDFEGRAYIVPPPSMGTSADSRPIASRQPAGSVLFLGRINPVKNLETLIDAWPLVRRMYPATKLVIAGDGDARYTNALKERATRNGVASSVEFAGFVSGVAKIRLLSTASVFVLPSHHENFGIAALEALEWGVPVIVSPEVQLAGFIRNHALGVVAPPGFTGLADAIVSMLADEEAHARVRTVGPQVVAENFSPKRIGELLSTMYRAVTKQSDPREPT